MSDITVHLSTLLLNSSVAGLMASQKIAPMSTNYDPRGDVLYLHLGEPDAADHVIETSEPNVLVRYDRHGNVIGLTILNVRWMLSQHPK